MANNYQISTLNMAATNAAFAITEGAVCDGGYLYVTPHNDYLIAKIDTKSFKIVETLDLSQVSSNLTGMYGSFIVDGFLYILPHLSNVGPVYQDSVVRVDLSNFTPAGCSTLKVMNATKEFAAIGGMTDGSYGYLNFRLQNQLVVIRFGLGNNFVASSVSTVRMTTVENMPAFQGNLIAVDESTVYMMATVITYPGTGNNDRTQDVWLVMIPTDDFSAKAATSQRLTNMNFTAGSWPSSFLAVDDGSTLWTPPMPITGGPQKGSFIGVMQIPKANPAKVTINQGPSSQPYPISTGTGTTTFYDGWRYGYATSLVAPQILQIDTKNPGTVTVIDITANAGSYAMFGLGFDGTWGYAVSFNGGAGLCLRFLPTPSPGGACPCCE